MGHIRGFDVDCATSAFSVSYKKMNKDQMKDDFKHKEPN